ncbi:hypothetical protein RVR34_25705 [Microcystis aeruginosa FBCC-A68]|uniref:hypothetical protein n=1 Tax=Microcystis aeruginosa TaxID=1126 RepID=UPI00148278DF|nr:hypothetical protein [Microcystis aeruginosa]
MRPGLKGQPITLLGDDLYSRQPMAEYCLEHNFNFIFVCLPTSHPALYEWLSFLVGLRQKTNREKPQLQSPLGIYFEKPKIAETQIDQGKS